MKPHHVLAAAFLLSFGTLACGQSALTEQQKADVIDGALARVREIYVEPADVGKIEAAIRDRAAHGEYRSISTPEAFANQLGEDLRKASGDPHFRVDYVPGEFKPMPTSMKRPPETEAQRRERLRISAVSSNNGFARVEYLEGNVGLIVLTSTPGPEEISDTLAAAMTFVKDTSALILDLRDNRGGDPAGVGYFLSYFVEGRIPVYDFVGRKPEDTMHYFTEAAVPGPRYAADKPVFVLTSARTFSGGEATVDAMRTWRHAKLIGERTKGGAVAALPVRAADHFGMGVPFMKTVNLITGKNWNGAGIEPDIAVPAEKAQDTAYLLALEHIEATTQGPIFRARVHAIIEKLKPKPDQPQRAR
jgi:retinol-binding protein 3